jgi:hypothetical protein
MPDVTLLVIVGVALWATLLVLVWAMCVAAARADGQDGRLNVNTSTKRPTVVADTGAIRDHLQDALPIVGARQLSLTVEIEGREAVLASVPGAVEARDEQAPRGAVPVRVSGHVVATLAAVREPGQPRFGPAELMMLRGVADTIAQTMETALSEASGTERSSRSVPVDAPSAMA